MNVVLGIMKHVPSILYYVILIMRNESGIMYNEF